jgi:hypothetical protein
MTSIVVLSDIHLSPTHGFFWENWCVARYQFLRDMPPSPPPHAG